jgi:tripartite-type tricarboxylate transporter receptor subunit TctC
MLSANLACGSAIREHPVLDVTAGRIAPHDIAHAVVVEVADAHELDTGWMRDPKLKARFADLGAMTLGGSPGEFGTLIAAETEKWAKVIRTANIKVG